VAFVYVLRCRDGSLYTGVAKDVAARLRRHRAGRASRYTRARLPVRLLWSREVPTWGAALREEHRIKRLPRREKEALLEAGGVPRRLLRRPRAAPRRRTGRLRGAC
jgi:putative endonuclease